jgi:hypothetical protein
MLNTEFFEEVRKVDESELMHQFGPKVGKLLYNHAILEEKFQASCVDDGVKMSLIEEMYEEPRQVAMDLKTSTQKLVREFSAEEYMLKLKASTLKKDSPEFSSFILTMSEMSKLYEIMLSTPKEEVQSI